MRVLNCFCLRTLPIFTTDIRYFITGYVTIDDVAKTVDVKRTSGGDRGYPFYSVLILIPLKRRAGMK